MAFALLRHGWTMTDINHILCPVDRSEIARRALLVAAALARWHDARLRVMEVVSVPLPAPSAAPAAIQGLSMDVRRGLLEELDRFAEPARSSGVPMHFTVEEGNVVNEILSEAAEHHADLIVMGTHGRSGFDRVALGSVTEKVLRRAPCPVLTVPPADTTVPVADGPPFKRIVCAVDFSDASLKGLDHAVTLAQEDDAQLFVTHVIAWPDDATLPPALAQAITSTRREWEHEKLRQLQQLVPESARTWCRPETVLRVGSPARELLRLAAERDADLIVMGVHGHGAIDRALFGATAHKVVRDARCAVLTVRTRK
jgi:nucleotide-binding universal stress UspA family protein